MKWVKIKSEMKRLGIKDDDNIWYIDTSFDDDDPLKAEKHARLGWAIGN